MSETHRKSETRGENVLRFTKTKQQKATLAARRLISVRNRRFPDVSLENIRAVVSAALRPEPSPSNRADRAAKSAVFSTFRRKKSQPASLRPRAFSATPPSTLA